jgi:GT2 family glycosyltransferase
LLGILPVFDDGMEPQKLSRPPFGANMAFRREAFERFGGFRPDLGRAGKNIMSNEDTEFGRRLMAAGEQLRYEASAVVYHPVAEDRLTKKYYLNWWFNFGRAEAREALASPFSALVRLATVNLGYRCLRWAVARHCHERFVRKIQVWKTAGQILELCRLGLQRDLPAGKHTNYPAIQSRSQKPAHAE